MRKIKKVVTTEVTLSSDEEYALLRHMIDTRKPSDSEHGALLTAGTVLEITKYSEERSYLEVGQIVIIRADCFADGEGDYPMWYINSDGELDEGWAKLNFFKVWQPSPKKAETKRGRRLKLDETADG